MDLFFVLSGFAIYHGYSDKLAGGQLTLKSFMKKRIKKIYFVYLIMTIVGWIYMTQICDYDIVYTTIKLPGHLLFLQPWIVQYSTAFNGAAWYVASLMWLYLFFYIFLQMGSKKKKWIFLSFSLLYLLLTILYKNELALTPFDVDHNPFTCFLYFSLGVISAYCYKNYPLGLSGIFFSILEFVLLCAMGVMTFKVQAFSPVANVVICLFFCVLYYVFAHEKGFFSVLFGQRVFSILSSYTYYFYMVHYMVIQYFIHIYKVNEISIFQTLLLFVLTALFSYALKAVEDHVYKKARNNK